MKEYIKKLYNKDKESYCKELKSDLKNNRKRFIVTVNPETLMISKKDNGLKTILDDNNISFVPDGIAVVKASKWLNMPVKERIAGIDIAQYLFDIANKNAYSMCLFGTKKEIIEALVNKVKKEYPNIKLLGYSDGYVSNKDKVMKKIVKLKPDICIVGLGIPKQEKLVYKYFDKFDKGIFIGVGGALDVLSGYKKRAPKFFIKTNTEWLYRIICEPTRMKRFKNYNIRFVFNILREKNKHD